MNKNVKRIITFGTFLLLIFTVFSLRRILWIQSDRTLEFDAQQSESSMQEPLLRDGKILLRLANNQGSGHPASLACDYFAEKVKERTDGRIEIINYHSAQLGDEMSVIPQVMYGAIDLARVSCVALTDYAPELIALQMPYLYENAEHMWNVLDSEIGDAYLTDMQELGMEGLCWYDAGARNFYTTNREICEGEDLQGLKIRVQESDYMSDVIRALGAEPVEISFGKVGMALKNGDVDGAENNFSSLLSTGHYLYVKHLVVDEHVRIPEMIIMNKRVLEQLSEEDQKIIRQAALESSRWQRVLWKENETESVRILEKAGVKITQIDNKEQFIERVQPVYDKYGKGYKDLIRQIQKLKSN